MEVRLNPIEAHERTIGQIFSDTYAFEIPAYQRPYAWQEEHVRELLADLISAMDDKNSNGGVYFLGSIVLIKSPSDPHSMVIDGQQRLTTLTIILSVLRDLSSSDEKRIDRRSYIFQKASADRGTSDRFRLLLRERDRPFFLQWVQRPGATDHLHDLDNLDSSKYRIAANTRQVRQYLQILDENRRDALMAFIIQRCYLVVVAVPTAEAARRIFTVLNARGLDLTATDILKADILNRANGIDERSIADRWESVEQALGRDEMVELFGHIRMLYERDKPRLALEIGFPRFVEPFQSDAEQFISSLLEPISDAFLLLSNNKKINEQFGETAAKAIRSLFRIDNKDWIPAALMRLWKRKDVDNKNISEFLIRLERLAYYLFVTRSGVNERIMRFAAVIEEIEPSGKEREIGLALSEEEQQDFLEELDGPIYKLNRVCRPVLSRLDEDLSTGGASYTEIISIEHVLPQAVDEKSEWANTFPDAEMREEWTHRLANLVLLTHKTNTRASNWDFERKKKTYFSDDTGRSPFLITQDVLATAKWTPEVLEQRQEKLLQRLARIWDLDLEKLRTASKTDKEKDKKKKKSGFTSGQLINKKRDAILSSFSHKLGIPPIKASGATFASEDGTLRIVCTISKRYYTKTPYWYGFSPQWDEFLSGTPNSFFILGCMDRESAFALPHSELKKILDNLHRTPEKHWHIVLDESEKGDLNLIVAKNSSKISLKPFEIPLINEPDLVA